MLPPSRSNNTVILATLLLFSLFVSTLSWTKRLIQRPLTNRPRQQKQQQQQQNIIKTARQYGNNENDEAATLTEEQFNNLSAHYYQRHQQRKLQPDKVSPSTNTTLPLSPSVFDLIQYRLSTGSTPGARSDPFHLALSIEGGGMRGAVSAGMARALEEEGILEAVDSIYGSSAGALIGAYLVARQSDCCNVYTDILPAAQRKFICGRRLVRGLVRMTVDRLLGTQLASRMKPAMNISMILDDVVTNGESSLDMDLFAQNDRHQPLRVVVSCVDSKDANGTVVSKSFGTPEFKTVRRGNRHGLLACLEASMSVPAVTGPLIPLQFSNGTTYHAFDAFVAEPIPYRSAVAEGATHVLALCSRPINSTPRDTPGLYERVIAPLFFHPTLPFVAAAMRRGDSLAVYEADTHVVRTEQGYGNATVWGLAVPPEEPELGTTSLNRRAIVQALRAGRSVVQEIFGKAPVVVTTTTTAAI